MTIAIRVKWLVLQGEWLVARWKTSTLLCVGDVCFHDGASMLRRKIRGEGGEGGEGNNIVI